MFAIYRYVKSYKILCMDYTCPRVGGGCLHLLALAMAVNSGKTIAMPKTQTRNYLYAEDFFKVIKRDMN